jgi:hypothetical protein
MSFNFPQKHLMFSLEALVHSQSCYLSTKGQLIKVYSGIPIIVYISLPFFKFFNGNHFAYRVYGDIVH